jgi:hypothetical protein
LKSTFTLSQVTETIFAFHIPVCISRPAFGSIPADLNSFKSKSFTNSLLYSPYQSFASISIVFFSHIFIPRTQVSNHLIILPAQTLNSKGCFLS